jgi:hypothetical protein
LAKEKKGGGRGPKAAPVSRIAPLKGPLPPENFAARQSLIRENRATGGVAQRTQGSKPVLMYSKNNKTEDDMTPGRHSDPTVRTQKHAVLHGFLLGLAAILIGLQLDVLTTSYPVAVLAGRADFRANYTAGYMLLAGKPLYDSEAELELQNQIVSPAEIPLPFTHPAYEALLYLPFSLLPFREAFWLWSAVNLSVLALIYFLLREYLQSLSRAHPWLPTMAVAAYLPFGFALAKGQDSLLLVLLLALAFARLRTREDSFLAGLCLGLGAFRFQLVVPVVTCFLFWRRWRFVTGFLSGVLPLAALSIALAGFWPYVRALQSVSSSTAHVRAFIQPAAGMPNLRGLIQSVGGGEWALLLVSALVLGIAIAGGRKSSPQQQLALAIIAACFVSYHLLVHDLSVLFIPCAWLLARDTGKAAAVAGVIFLAPVLFLFALDHSYFVAFGLLPPFVYLAVPSLGIRRTLPFGVGTGASH